MKSPINSRCWNPVFVASLVKILALFSWDTMSYRSQSFQYLLPLLSSGTFYASKLVWGTLVYLYCHTRVFWYSYSSTSTERKGNFHSGMYSQKHFSGPPLSWSLWCSKIDPKHPKQHPLFTVFWSISSKRKLSELISPFTYQGQGTNTTWQEPIMIPALTQDGYLWHSGTTCGSQDTSRSAVGSRLAF